MNDREADEDSSGRQIDASNAAFFFDLDGTLAEIVRDPEQVRVGPPVLDALAKLHHSTSGAIAIISGRPVAVLDRLLSPLKLPLSGVHGLEWRSGDGTFHRQSYNAGQLRRLHRALSDFAYDQTGLIVEEKPGSVALHYRQRPELEESCVAFAGKLAAGDDGIALMRGKMVVELRLGGRSKADAVAAFMATEPFHGRTPVFAGDDVTDEDAFRFAEEAGGVGIKIGAGETAASLRVPDRQAFETWLRRMAASAEANANLFSGGEIHSAALHMAAANSGA